MSKKRKYETKHSPPQRQRTRTRSSNVIALPLSGLENIFVPPWRGQEDGGQDGEWAPPTVFQPPGEEEVSLVKCCPTTISIMEDSRKLNIY